MIEARAMESTHLIPRDKFDIDAVRRAGVTGYPAIGPVLGELLEWLKDGNWPVAVELVPVLADVGEPLVPHLLGILRGDDAVWKYWILTMLVKQLDAGTRGMLMEECRRIAEQPTDEEAAEGVDEAARDDGW